MFVVFQGFTVMENFFTEEEFEPGRKAYARLIDHIAHRLYDTGRVKSKYRLMDTIIFI